MKKRCLFLILLVIIIGMANNLFAQKVASTSMQFLKVMPCARAAALGDAYSTWAKGAEALFWNPSGLALTQSHEFSTTYINWIFDAQQGAFAYAMTLEDIGSFGVQVQYVDYGTFEEAVLTRPAIKNVIEPGLTGRTFKPFSYLFGLSFARSLTDRFSTGISVKYAHESLFDQKKVSVLNPSMGISENVNTYGNVLLFDFGIRYNTGFRSIEVGTAVQNFGPQIKYALEKSPAPLLFRVGAAADVVGPNSLLVPADNYRVGVAVDIFHPNDYDQQAHIGMEYEFMNTIALRMGYKYNYDSENFTFGGGIHHTIGNIDYRLDYGYVSLGKYLGNTHRISLGVGLQ